MLRTVNTTFALERKQQRWLSREQLSAHSKDGVVIVTWANEHFSDFVQNFVRSLQRLGLDNYLVGSLDDELLATMAASGDVPESHVFRMLADSGLESGARQHWAWGSPRFNQMGKHKGELMRSVLALRLTLLLCDVDTVWLRDPMPFFNKYPQADLLITSDAVAPSLVNAEDADAPWAAADGGLEAPTVDVGHVIFSQLLLTKANIGIMLLRPTVPMRLMVEEYMDVLAKSPAGSWDQSIFNGVLRSGFDLSSPKLADLDRGPGLRMHEQPLELRGVDIPHTHADRTVDLFCGLLRVGWLPVPTFAHGHGFFVSRLHELSGQQPFVVHNTYQYWGSSGKRMRFREAGLWFADKSSRFELTLPSASREGLGSPWAAARADVAGSYPARPASKGGGLLRAALFVPASALERVDVFAPSHNASRLPRLHVQLVQAQVGASANLLALARALRRVLELPSTVCSCDRTFLVAWNCSYWPLSLQRPFPCPVDHVFSLGAWDDLKLPYREPGFWDRRDSSQPPNAEARVHLCGARASASRPGSASLARIAASVGAAPGEGAAAEAERVLGLALAARCRQAEAEASATNGSLTAAAASARTVEAFRRANEGGLRAFLASEQGGSSSAEVAARAALLPRGLSDEAIARVLEPFSSLPSLALDSTDGLLSGFALEQNQRSFKQHFEGRLAMDWCCTPTGGVRFNFTAGAQCDEPGRVAIFKPRANSNDRIVKCEGALNSSVSY